MNNMYIRTGLLFGLSLVGFIQPALSATIEFEDSQQKVDCGEVASLTVTTDKVVAKATGTCLTVSGPDDKPKAAPKNYGTVNTNDYGTKNVTDGAEVKLPLPPVSVDIVDQPGLPGAYAVANGATATYYAPTSEDITASAPDSFTYTITDATQQTSDKATASVYVNWVEVKSDGCTSATGIECKGPTPDWPDFHVPITHQLAANTTHVWSFVYDPAPAGQLGPVFAANTLNFKISDTVGDTQQASIDCWRGGGDYVYYEPAPGIDPYACDLTQGQQYYFNIRNLGANTTYQLSGFDDQ